MKTERKSCRSARKVGVSSMIGLLALREPGRCSTPRIPKRARRLLSTLLAITLTKSAKLELSRLIFTAASGPLLAFVQFLDFFAFAVRTRYAAENVKANVRFRKRVLRSRGCVVVGSHTAALGNMNEWLEAARQGSPDALGQVLEYCRPYLLAVANEQLETDLQAKAGASDLVQDTFVEAHPRLRYFPRQERRRSCCAGCGKSCCTT